MDTNISDWSSSSNSGTASHELRRRDSLSDASVESSLGRLTTADVLGGVRTTEQLLSGTRQPLTQLP